MILVNTTFSIESSAVASFTDFITKTYIPAAEKAGMYDLLLCEVRERENGNGTHRTFALQMRAPSQDALDGFSAGPLAKMYRFIGRKWGQRIALFETVLDVIHDAGRLETENND